MDFLSRKKELSSTESAHIIIFFSLSKHTTQPVTEQKKETPTRKKNVILYLLRALVVAKEKRDERDARKSSSSYSSPFTVLARCHASFRYRFFERVSERNFKSSRVSNVMRFYFVRLLPRFWFYPSSHTMCSFFAHFISLSLSLSLSLKTETNNAL